MTRRLTIEEKSKETGEYPFGQDGTFILLRINREDSHISVLQQFFVIMLIYSCDIINELIK